jgi:hypothetical protein
MALISSIIKNSSKETVVKVEGASGNTTIALNSLSSADQVLGASGATGYVTPTVNIAAVMSSGNINSALVINRGATGATGYQTFAAAPENSPTIQFNQYGFTDNLQNTQDIVVTHSGAQATTYLVLRKVDGYYSKVENEKYGAYDDPSRVGASTTMPGSPDKV